MKLPPQEYRRRLREIGLPVAPKRHSMRALKNHLWFTQHGRAPRVKCHWCATMLTFTEATVDHEPALAEGGDLRRAVIACAACNERRGRETDERIRAKRRSRLDAVLPFWRSSNW